MDVCIFCMYVQEYDNQDKSDDSNQRKRVYIAYLDSVEHLQPRRLRTMIYHEILVSYIATARVRGYEVAHIWSCPPSRGNSFVFWSHPATQRTPNGEHLLSWYHKALSYAVSQGIVTDIESLFDFSFQKDTDNSYKDNGCIMMAPPLLEGDFWMEEASRVYSASIIRLMKCKKPSTSHSGSDSLRLLNKVLSRISSLCPAVHVATLLHDCVMTHNSALAFCRPVNAIALKLHDYHDIIKHPMDLGTIHSRCLLGEYDTYRELQIDIELVFQNAMKYNPKGHIVHTIAEEMLVFTQNQLKALAQYWANLGVSTCERDANDGLSFEDFGKISMRLGARIIMKKEHNLQLKTANPLCSIVSVSAMPQATEQKRNISNDDIISKKHNIITGGPEAIVGTMVGTDIWLLNKKTNYHTTQGKNKKKKLKKSVSDDVPPPVSCQRRTESWLGDEVSAAVRRLRTDFFVCHLVPKKGMTDTEKDLEASFSMYVQVFRNLLSASEKEQESQRRPQSGVADTRNGFLEISQYRNFQFDTIRRAKYSTAMLIHYLQNPTAPGLIPTCTMCQNNIADVRWHRVNKAFDERRRNSTTLSVRTTSVPMDREELCDVCFSQTGGKHDFIPVRVSL